MLGLYHKLSSDFADMRSVSQKSGAKAMVDFILQNRQSLDLIEGMTPRILRLANEWAQSREQLQNENCRQIQSLIAAARTQTQQLKEFCNIHVCELQTVRAELDRELAEIQKGIHYLESLKPVKGNFPKFIDSHG